MTRTNSHNHQQPAITLIPTPEPHRLALNFVLSDCPSTDRLPIYATAFKQHKVRILVRICDAGAYDKAALESLAEICVTDNLKFEDGGVPSPEQVSAWLDLVESEMVKKIGENIGDGKAADDGGSTGKNNSNSQEYPAIALHCVSGLGRAPVLVAVAILEYCAHMESLDVVEYLRKYRRGVLNSTQLHWLEEVYWKKLRHKRKKKGHGSHGRGIFGRIKSLFKSS